MSLPLRLTDTSSVQSVYNAGISVENMTWWFWIKAGMGFTIGAGIVTVTAAICWGIISLGIITGFLRAVAR